MTILKIMFLFFAVLYTIANLTKIKYKNDIPSGNILFQTIGIIGFIVIQFNLYI